jgi:hypothetical protein
MVSPYALSDVALGDVVDLPDGRSMTVRGKVTLPLPAGSMAGFLITGEFETLLSLPSSIQEPLLIYVPIDYLPKEVESGKVSHEGAMNYWSPHLPALQGAMGEVLYRVVLVRGSVDPVVIIYRGREIIVFIRSSTAALDDVSVLKMRRDVDNQIQVDRHSAVVIPSPLAPSSVPVEERETVA